MKKGIFILIIILFSVTVSAKEFYFKFDYSNFSETSKLAKIISVDRVKNGEVFAYANEKEFAKFKALKISYQILTNPSLLTEPRMGALSRAGGLKAWDVYPSYNEYEKLMSDFEQKYPSICKLYEIGKTVKGRKILALKITKNVTQESTKPEFLYSSTMHGDEVTGMMMFLRLADYFLTNYSKNAEVTSLIDNLEIWINPLTNPDGTYSRGNNSVKGATRSNGNYIDLNRNFPDPSSGNEHPDGNAWQPETLAMMNFYKARHFVGAANLHGGAEVINFPWDSMKKRHPDNDWFIEVSKAYAQEVQSKDQTYMTDVTPNGITNGADWYVIGGGMQDYQNYFMHIKGTTFEVSSVKLPDSKRMPYYFDLNRDALIHYIENNMNGLHGVITDAKTKKPILAKVEIVNLDADGSFVYSDANLGDYHRPLLPGNYTLKISANGYNPKTIQNVVVNNSMTNLDIELE